MINKILESYKKITENIIINIKNDIDIDALMDKRERLIKELFKDEDISNDNIKELYLSYGLLELDNKLKRTIEEEQFKVKEEIKNLHRIKNANNAYGNNKRVNSFFNAKI
jgi:predicted RND superfamily exporter protein